MFLADFCIPLVAIASKDRYAMWPVRDAGPRRTREVYQLNISHDNPEGIETQETTEQRHSVIR